MHNPRTPDLVTVVLLMIVDQINNPENGDPLLHRRGFKMVFALVPHQKVMEFGTKMPL